MSVEVHEEAGGVLVVRSRERRLDAACAKAFVARLDALIDGGHDRIVLDVQDIDFVDSTGLGAIVAVLKRLGARGGLAICGVRERVHAILRIARIDRLLPIVAAREEALARLR